MDGMDGGVGGCVVALLSTLSDRGGESIFLQQETPF
jgi:hypothetical protein